MLMPCPECGSQVSTKAASCPSCGCAINIRAEPVHEPVAFPRGEASDHRQENRTRRSNTFRWAALFLIVVALGAVATTVLVVVITSTSKGIHASPESLARAVLVAMQNRSIDALVECLPAPQRDEFRQTFKSMPMPNSGITDFFIDSTNLKEAALDGPIQKVAVVKATWFDARGDRHTAEIVCVEIDRLWYWGYKWESWGGLKTKR